MNISPELRIGDAEREAAASALGEHFASGRLTHGEFDERLAAVWSAKTNSDLLPLFADLPATHLAGRSTRPAASQAGPSRSRGTSSGTSPRRRWGGVPLLPVIVALVVLLVALPGAPWPLFVLGWLWVFGFFGRGWFGCSRRGHPR